MKKIMVLLACSFAAALVLACSKPSYVNLGQKAAEVDSLVIKGRAAGATNMDSLRAARKEKALFYIAGVDPFKIKDADYHAAARLFYAAGKSDSALVVLEKNAPAQGNKDALDLLFNIYLEKGKNAEAERLFNEKLKQTAGDESAQYYMGLLYGYQEQNQLQNAIAIADAAIAALPAEQAGSIILEKADMINQSGDKKAALALLQQLKTANPDDARMKRAVAAKSNLFNMIGNPGSEWKASVWIDSGPLTLKSLRGKVVFIDFWAPWCGPCRAMFPHIKQLYADYKDKGLVIVGLTRYYGRFNQLGQNLRDLGSADELEWIKIFKQHHKIPFAYAVAEGEAAMANELAYGVYGIPHMVLIDRKGMVRYYAIGSGPASEEKLSKGVAELIAEAE